MRCGTQLFQIIVISYCNFSDEDRFVLFYDTDEVLSYEVLRQ